MVTKHDQLMKELIARYPEHFLRLAAPDLAARLDLERVVFEPEEHYPGAPSGRERRTDLVARAFGRPAGDAAAYGEAEEVMLHAELELDYRARTAPRLLGYHRGLSLKYERVVHTIVLYLRGGPPGPQTAVYEERSLGETVVAFRYHSFGLSQAPSADYLARPEPLAWAFAALTRPAKGQSRPQLGLACLRRIVHARDLTQAEREPLFKCVLRYAPLGESQIREFDKMLAEAEEEEVRTMATTMFDWWRKQGRTEGQRDLVLQLLKERFGSLSSDVRRKVSAIESTDELTQLASRLYQVKSLEELGLA